MKRGGGKGKGGEWERQVCKDLSLWLTNGNRQDCLWRSAMSGGRATVNRKRGVGNKTQCGDISAVSPEGHKLTDLFVIECKFYKNLDLATSLLLGRGKLAEFWKEVCDEALRAGKEPLLIARQNRFEPLILTTLDTPFVELGYIATRTYCIGELPAYVGTFKSLLRVQCPL